MLPSDRQKICPHCEGRIVIDATHCLYCGMPVSSLEKPKEAVETNPLHSLYPPSYSNKPLETMKNDKISPKPFSKDARDNQLSAALGKYSYSPTTPIVNAEEKKEEASSFSPLFFLLLGSNLMVIGLLQLLFAEKGLLTLQWKSHYWYLYCLIALPAIILGLKKAKQLKQ
jgi:hypothetical protein